MKNGKSLLLIGALVATVAFVAKGAKKFADNIGISFRDIGIDSQKTKAAGYLTLHYVLRLIFNNPEPFSITVNSLNLQIYVGDNHIGQISRTTPFDIKANSSQEIPFNLAVSTFNLGLSVSDIIQILKNGASFPNVTVRGYLVTRFGRVNVEQSIPVSI